MEWKTVKLGDVCEIIKNREKGILIDKSNYISTENMLPNKGGVVPSSITPYEGAIIYHPKDVLISNIRPYFKKIWFADKIGGCSGDVLCLRSNAKMDSTYLYYLLSQDSFFDYVMAGSKGTKMPRGDKGQIMQYKFSLPSLETQHRIAVILSALDDKIENNNRINANLEAQAQALFKSWFVDFEPFGGVMPEDWKFDDISNIPHVLETGRRPKGGAVESGVPSIGAEHIKGMGTYDFSKTKYITEDYARSMKSGKINGYELLIYKDGGKPGYFIPNFTIYGEGYPFEECYINEHVLKLDFPSKAYNIFCYFYFQTPEVMNYLNAQGGKAAIPGINKSDIDNINILTPDNNTVVQFGDIVLPYFTSILQNLAENKRLAKLRDTLLPKLMKGEINI